LPSKDQRDTRGAYPKQEKVPQELIQDEYPIVQRGVAQLAKRLSRAADPQEQTDLLVDATCDYSMNERVVRKPATRPLILDRCDSRLDELRTRLTKPNPPSTGVTYELVGELFVMSAATVKTQVRTKPGRLTKLKPSEPQLYLVAMFLLASRFGNKGGNLRRLTKILDALFRSRYDAKPIYHLARRISTLSEEEMASPAWQCRPEICWEDVNAVCNFVRGPVHQDQTAGPDESP
jgi:hypothetical protein